VKSVETTIDLFRQKGFKITPQRRLIFELLINNTNHPTAEEICQRVRAVMPEVSRTTVYNTLRDLVALGELAAVEDVSESGTRYDTNIDQHHHLFCVKCRSLKDIGQPLTAHVLQPQEAAGYRIFKSQVTYYGICPDCQAG
jgi:Fe2+ or Zn2+ uptake regulation protein